MPERFARRLRSALDDAGFPITPRVRLSQFRAEFNLNDATAAQLLGGLVLPDWDTLVRICTFLGRQPGFFLDAQLPDLPEGTRTAKSLTLGEPLAFRLPSYFDRRFSGHDYSLNYLLAQEPMGFGVHGGDVVITAHAKPEPMPVQLNNLYLIGMDPGFALARCTAIENGRAIMQVNPSGPKDPPRIIPAGNSGRAQNEPSASDPPHFGVVAAILRSADLLASAV